MRRDMAKKLVERPRGGAGWKRPGRTRPVDELPGHEPMSMGRGSKFFGENLAPLHRFLVRRVGHSWDEVYSEIRSRLSPRSAVHMHVMQHLWHMVERYPVMIHGKPHHPRWFGKNRFLPLRGTRWDCLYVCPESGILKIYRARRRPRREPS